MSETSYGKCRFLSVNWEFSKSSQISRFSDTELNSKFLMCHGFLTFKGISNVFSQMGSQTPAVISTKYCNTCIYFNFIIKTYPYYVTKSLLADDGKGNTKGRTLS